MLKTIEHVLMLRKRSAKKVVGDNERFPGSIQQCFLGHWTNVLTASGEVVGSLAATMVDSLDVPEKKRR